MLNNGQERIKWAHKKVIRTKNSRYLEFLILVLFVVGAAWGITALSKPKETEQKYLTCQVFYRNDQQIKVGSQTINVQLATTPREQQKGLGGRDCINPDQGMLFVFDEPGRYAFWMKDMEFPIDMVWISEDKKVVKVQADVSPATYPDTFVNDEPAKYVLELKAGRAAQLGLQQDSTVSF